MKHKRIEWLDIAKGIGILLVISGHCLNLNGRLCQLIFTFHMPLFFLLSGYVFKDKVPFVKFTVKKIKSLIFPFIGYFALGTIVTLLLPQWRDGFTLEGVKSDLWLANPDHAHNSSIWFLICLFFVSIVFWLLMKLPKCFIPILLFVIYELGIKYSIERPIFLGYNRLPFNLDVLPIALTFFAIGYFIKQLKVMDFLSSNWTYELNAFIIGMMLTILVYKSNGYVNMHGLSFSDPILYLIGGLAGTFCIIGISSIISRFSLPVFRWIKSIFMWYGTHSLTILGVQSLLIRLYIIVCNKYFDTQLSLYQFPKLHAIISTVIISFLICPIICFIWDNIKCTIKLTKRA